MKKILLITAVLASTLFGCQNSKTAKYIVTYKKSTEAGMCHSDREVKISRIYFHSMPHTTVRSHHSHSMQPATYELTLSNETDIQHVNVSSWDFNDYNVLDVVEYNPALNSIRIIKKQPKTL